MAVPGAVLLKAALSQPEKKSPPGSEPVNNSSVLSLDAPVTNRFAPFVVGATPAARSATLLGFSLIHHALGLAGQVAVGAVCFALLKRRGIPALAGSPAGNDRPAEDSEEPTPKEGAPEPGK